jgi:hypothetical protein
MSVSVLEDYKLRDLRVSHTLGWSGLDVELCTRVSMRDPVLQYPTQVTECRSAA